jgi:hypothetical protein
MLCALSLSRTLNAGVSINCVADETQRRITLLPERLHEDSKVALKNIFGPLSNVLEELSNKEANDILVRASPKEVSDCEMLKPWSRWCTCYFCNCII